MVLVLNSIYIYWVGAESLTKSRYLFNRFSIKGKRGGEQLSDELSQKLQHYLETEEIYTNKNLKVSDLATLVGTTEKDLSSYIHEVFGVSFSDYINQYRVDKVKKLLIDEEQKQYTLVAIAENAGFSSKSSFNAVFKRLTGLTPSQYKKQHKG